MSRYLYKGSFVEPAGKPQYMDGRDRCDQALKAIFAAGPQRPDSLAKRARSDAGVNALLARKLSRQDRLRRSNAHEALEEVKKVHRAGGRRGVAEAEGDEPHISRSVNAIRKAQRHALHVGNHRMLSAQELNKAFATDIGKLEVGITLDTHGYATGFYPMTKVEKRGYLRRDASNMHLSDAEFRKGLGSARPRTNDVGVTDSYGGGAPESLNGVSGGAIADTGAANDWHDQITPSVKATQVGTQFLGVPDASQRDAAVEAIKMALRKPQRLGGARDDDTADQDRTDDLDEDEEDLDETDARGKNPNAADSFDGNRKRKARPDEDEDEDEDE